MIANQNQIEPKRDTSFEPVNGKERKNIAALVRSGTVEELELFLNIMLELRYCRGQRDGLEQGKKSGMDAIDKAFGTPTSLANTRAKLDSTMGSAIDRLNAVFSGDARRAAAAPKPADITAAEEVVDPRSTPLAGFDGGDGVML